MSPDLVRSREKLPDKKILDPWMILLMQEVSSSFILHMGEDSRSYMLCVFLCIQIFSPLIVSLSGLSGWLRWLRIYACNARDRGDLGLIPGSRRSPWGGNGNRLQYSYLENPMDRGAGWATVHEVAKSWTRLSDFAFILFHISQFKKYSAFLSMARGKLLGLPKSFLSYTFQLSWG